jgi:hypothetical protein
MRNETPQFWFRSDLFAVDPAEDEETNPFCYGKQLALWVAEKFRTIGYSPEEVFGEDWGWCVMLERKPFMLWVGCTNIRSDLYERITPEQKPGFAPEGDKLTWTCVVGTDVPIWTAYFWKRVIGRASVTSSVVRVAGQLEAFLKDEARIRLTNEP